MSQFMAILFYGIIAKIYLQSANPRTLDEAPDYSGIRNGFLILSVALIPLSVWIKASFFRKRPQGPHALNQLMMMSIMLYVLGDSIAVLGLVTAVLMKQFSQSYAFLVLSLVALVFNFPRQEEWKRWMVN